LLNSAFPAESRVALEFRNGAERWDADVGEAEGHGIRFDGAKLPPENLIDINRDEMGGDVLVDIQMVGRFMSLLRRMNNCIGRKKFNWKSVASIILI
jgi:hypothetical protein